MFSHVVHSHIHEFHGVQSASPHFGCSRGMGGFPFELKLHTGHGRQGIILRTIGSPRAPGKHNVRSIENAFSGHKDFAHQRLLRRRPEDLQGALYFLWPIRARLINGEALLTTFMALPGRQPPSGLRDNPEYRNVQ
jgi:hypothetical protein